MTGFVEWDESFSVGVKEIDEQHKKLISILNTLYHAMSRGKGKEILTHIIEELKNYAVYHFSTEEEYMKKFNCKIYKEHKALHDEFMTHSKIYV